MKIYVQTLLSYKHTVKLRTTLEWSVNVSSHRPSHLLLLRPGMCIHGCTPAQLTLVVYCLSLPSDRRDTSEEMRLTVLCPACEGETGREHSSTNSPHSGSYFTLKEKVYRQTDR